MSYRDKLLGLLKKDSYVKYSSAIYTTVMDNKYSFSFDEDNPEMECYTRYSFCLNINSKQDIIDWIAGDYIYLKFCLYALIIRFPSNDLVSESNCEEYYNNLIIKDIL